MRLVVFDLDHTLITANSSFCFGIFLYRRHFFSCWTAFTCLIDYARYKWMGMPIRNLHAKIFTRLFKGRSLLLIRALVSQFLAESLDPLLYMPALERLKQAQTDGDDVFILSSSPDFLVEPIAEHLQVLTWKGTVYEPDENGELSAISAFMEGEDKASYLKELLEKKPFATSSITVYSDSALDLPLLKMAGQAIGVRPDTRLKKICLENGWEIL